MRIAPATGNCYPDHAEAGIPDFYNVFLGNWLPEAGPAGAGLEFRVGIEKSGVTADATEYTLVMNIQKFTGEWPFGSRMARYFKRIRGQLPLPIRVAFLNLRYSDDPLPHARIGEFHDGYLRKLAPGRSLDKSGTGFLITPPGNPEEGGTRPHEKRPATECVNSTVILSIQFKHRNLLDEIIQT
jgi:hypothetical protein